MSQPPARSMPSLTDGLSSREFEETAHCPTDGSRIHRDTEAAMDEMSQLFRRLFPLVPERTQYFWRTNQLGSALVYNEGLPRNVDESPIPSETVLPWKLQIEFRKRGPDCMKKCISQGVLHPVQCHSLC